MRQVGGHLIVQRWCGTHNKGSASSGSSSSVTGLGITIHCGTRCTNAFTAPKYNHTYTRDNGMEWTILIEVAQCLNGFHISMGMKIWSRNAIV